jgi:hypothetical protein
MIFMPTIECATSGETMNAADMGLPLRNKRTRHVQKLSWAVGWHFVLCTFLQFPPEQFRIF